ncbi:unnamed protein product [Rotaria sp. Silwood1]|nr:unnamed protein product [Rotaria sp. Silwood1]CAF1687508.1 unnamed protein product [Rotaria sp. Silwood1]CAF3849117.1 unnamed protein product [Rotaria sp. Silwood1]CAF3951352.1 unnamed protein product [Rotaria sp. Silwood1]CAF4981850.1 unnamed protein product [Rotaria sp. Silwood1]
MNHCFVNDLCTFSLSSYCDKKCGRKIHIPPYLPIYDGHIHLNQVVNEIQSELIAIKAIPSIREYHFVNNNHKPDGWSVLNSYHVPQHVHIYPTMGIHPKYFDPQGVYKILDDLQNHLEISHHISNSKNKIVAVGECGLDETAMTNIDQQLFVLEKQIDLANRFHLPLVIHCRGTHLYQKLFDCIKNRISDRNFPFHWHCINSNSNLHIIDLFLNQYPNSYIGFKGSITHGNNTENFHRFENWLIKRSPFLPERLIFETDYPYLPPENLHGKYDPTAALIASAIYLSKTITGSDENTYSYIHSSNINIISTYNL